MLSKTRLPPWPHLTGGFVVAKRSKGRWHRKKPNLRRGVGDRLVSSEMVNKKKKKKKQGAAARQNERGAQSHDDLGWVRVVEPGEDSAEEDTVVGGQTRGATPKKDDDRRLIEVRVFCSCRMMRSGGVAGSKNGDPNSKITSNDGRCSGR